MRSVYGHFTSGGMEERIAVTLPPVLRPKVDLLRGAIHIKFVSRCMEFVRWKFLRLNLQEIAQL
jgi:hypothetical protein